jgi:hypothetical protein
MGAKKREGLSESEAHVRAYRKTFRKKFAAALEKEQEFDSLTLLRVSRALSQAEREALSSYRDSRATALDTIEKGVGDAGR